MDTIKDLVDDSYGTATGKGWHDTLKAGAEPVTYPTTLPSGSSLVTGQGMVPQNAEVSVDYVATKLMLACGELHEALEELRAGHAPTKVYWIDRNDPQKLPRVLSVHDDPMEVAAAGDAKPEGFPIEVADCLIRIGDLCGLLGVDITEALNIKAAYNKSRPYRHGGKTA